jgi:CelD/BcsL family acetyltransferase involved in cellulose biosynthesis
VRRFHSEYSIESYYHLVHDSGMGELKNLRLVLLKQIVEDEDLRRQWNELVERAGDPQVFYTYEWALAVQRAYSDSLSPLIWLAYNDDGALCGVAALARSGVREVSFLCATTGDYCDFLSAPEDRSVFVAAVFSELRKGGVKRVRLTNLPADSCTFRAIQECARRSGYYCFQRLAYICAQFSLRLLDRSKNEKVRIARPKMIRRSLKAMSIEGAVRVDHARSLDEVTAVLPQFMKAHVSRFLITGRISNIARAERQVFLTELSRLLSASDWLCLTRLMMGEKTVAWNYGFQFHGSWFWYQPTFDSRVEKYSPGYCLLAKLIEEAADSSQFHTVDLGLGAEEYKDRASNQSRKTLLVSLDTSAFRHVYEISRYQITRLLTTSSRVERGARAIRALVGSLIKRCKLNSFRESMNWALKRIRTSLFARDEVFFYELVRNQPMPESNALSLRPIELDVLATAAMQYANDEGTLAYLLRCAKRLDSKEYAGFALVNRDGQAVHFTWAGPFGGFRWSELNSTLPPPSPDAVVLFDSWTPFSHRGRGYYAPTLVQVAERIQQQGKRAWGFSAATNTSSIRGLEKMSFPRRFSIVRRKFLWWQHLSRHSIESTIESEGPVAC